ADPCLLGVSPRCVLRGVGSAERAERVPLAALTALPGTPAGWRSRASPPGPPHRRCGPVPAPAPPRRWVARAAVASPLARSPAASRGRRAPALTAPRRAARSPGARILGQICGILVDRAR